jgi:serine/threonine protein kinase
VTTPVPQYGRPKLDQIGPYRVQRQLSPAGDFPGSSASGSVQVYLALEDGPLGFSRDVILKIASFSPEDDARTIKELGREATACAKLNHPGIVRTYQFFEHEGALVLVLEHVDGISLAELLATQTSKGNRLLTDDAALHVGISILEALEHAHGMLDDNGASAPVVHRAVSPSNILIARDGTVKLGGFGFAKISGVSSDTTGNLTWEPTYMAPEQITDQRLTPKVDVYATGLILWELLTGRPSTVLPKDPLAVEAILRAVTQRKPAPLATLRRDLPRELVAAIDASLTASPEKRTIGAGEMAQWIRKVVHVGQAKKELGARVRGALAGADSRGHAALSREEPRPQPKKPPSAVPPARASGHRRPTLLGVAPPPRAVSLPSPRIVAPPKIELAAPIATELPELPGSPPLASDPLESVDVPLSTVILQWSLSLIYRLHAPTPWSRRTWAAAWAALVLGLVMTILILPSRRPRVPEATAEEKGPAPGLTAARTTPPPPAATRAEPPSSEPPSSEPPSSEPPSSDAPLSAPQMTPQMTERDDPPETPPRRGYGYLTVHSYASYANVYVMFTRYGRVEHRLGIPCGKRFISIGVPSHTGTEPIWLAPGRAIHVPCGGSREVTMNPRALR